MDHRPTFRPSKFKTTTRAQWQAAAEAWHRWGPFLGNGSAPPPSRCSTWRISRTGSRVLDIAAGAGEQSLAAARRVGPTGHVLATDIAPALLDHALPSRRGRTSNIETRELDGEALETARRELRRGDLPRRTDLLPGPAARAGRNPARIEAGRPIRGDRVLDARQECAFFSIPVGIIRRRAKLPPPLPGQPGPFSLGSDGVLAAAYERAGLRDIEVCKVDSPVRLPSAAECVRFERESFGALHQMMSTLSEAERAETWDEIERELRQFETKQAASWVRAK